MLLANKVVATRLHESGNPGAILRKHDPPEPKGLQALGERVEKIMPDLKWDSGTSAKLFQSILKIKASRSEIICQLFEHLTMKTMRPAEYGASGKHSGMFHYALGFEYYTHFTSPIRRYPDMMAHRMLRRHLDGSNIAGQEIARFEQLSVQSSEREMHAVRAERDSIKYKQVEFMAPKVGQEFTGIVSGVSDWGLYVEEKESKSEGMVRLSSLRDDYYEHLASAYAVKGQRTGKVYRLGDEVRFKVVRADLEEKQLDFELVK